MMMPREKTMSEGPSQEVVIREIQRELRDLLCLAVLGDHLRWVLAGDETAELANGLAEATARWRASADPVAKHLLSLGVPPDGRVRSLSKDIPLNWVPDGWLSTEETQRLLTARLGTVAEWTRDRGSQASDAKTRELFDTACSALDTQMCAPEITRGKSTRALERRDATAAEMLHGRTR
jgi:starvation-inducible DNA-binding protein